MGRGINAWAVGVVRYSAGILDWTCHELKKLDTKTRKILTMAGAFNRKSSTVRLYRKRNEGGRGLISIEDCVRCEEANLSQYVQNSDEWLLKEVIFFCCNSVCNCHKKDADCGAARA